MTAPASYDPARIREAIQTALADPAQHSNPEVADWITQQVTDRLTRALESGDWSFGTAETIVMDTHDEADAPPGEEWTISPDETEAVVNHINERLFAATGRRLARPVTGLGGDLPAGFTLAEASPGQWRLTVPVGDLVAFHLDATDQVALRRAAFGIANLSKDWFLPELVDQITAVLGPEADGEVAFTAAFDPFEVDVAGRSGRPGFLEVHKQAPSSPSADGIEYAARYREAPPFWRGRGAVHIEPVSDGSLERAEFAAHAWMVIGMRGVRVVKRRDGGPWETHRKVNPGRAIARRLTAVFRKEATS